MRGLGPDGLLHRMAAGKKTCPKPEANLQDMQPLSSHAHTQLDVCASDDALLGMGRSGHMLAMLSCSDLLYVLLC